MNISADILKAIKKELKLLENIIAYDESWIFYVLSRNHASIDALEDSTLTENEERTKIKF